MQLIECVPNISEGRDQSIIDHLVQSIRAVKGAYLLHQDSGYGVNRTVITMAGSPDAIVDAAFNMIAETSKLIDMRAHKGSHPRIGATDVCPIVPLANITMAECIELSKNLACRVGNELGIPVYLYGESAQSPERKSLAYIRGGEYENLFLRIDELVFKPDFGPVVCNAKSGATAIGARKILIAYNIHLDTKDLRIAKAIAQTIRERRQNNKQSLTTSFGIDEQLNQKKQTVNWQESLAIAWYIEEYQCCQISLNLLDYTQTSIHEAYMGVQELASEHGVAVTGSEIIGLAPLNALLNAGKFILASQNKTSNTISDKDLLEAAVNFLGLNQISSFKASEKVLEYKLAEFGLSAPTIL